MNNKIIEDIYYGYNDVDTKWVPTMNWTYYRNFTGIFIVDTCIIFNNYLIFNFSVESRLLRGDNINLVFEGLDTFAEIFVNNIRVGESKNMFVQYIFNIQGQLKVGERQ